VEARLCKAHKHLRRAGRKWSHHITETYWATFLSAAYVLLTVITGFLPVTSLGTWALESAADELLGTVDELRGKKAEVAAWILRALDATIYVFLPAFIAMAHRKCTGRRVWARFTTRTLLLVESTVNYKLLRAYASKLLALSWRFATMSVVGQNGTDHFVHEFTHKAQSDVLVAVGMPDGRLHSVASAQGCVLMSVQQAKFIKGPGRGVEIFSLGHNPVQRPGLFVGSVNLPLRRPLFASERMLMPEQFIGKGKELSSGCHSLAPMTVLQRWGDLRVGQMDPGGLPRITMTRQDLQDILGQREYVDFAVAVKILEGLLDKCRLEMREEKIPQDVGRFLREYLDQHPARTRVYVASPEKSYASADQWYAGQGQIEASPAGCLKKMMSACSEDSGSPESTFRRGLTKRLGAGEVPTQCSAHNDLGTTFHSPCRPSQVALDADEFLAILHGDDLQKWVRSTRYRWGKLKSLRSMMLHFAEDFNKPQDSITVVLSNGVTMASMFVAWRQQVTPRAWQSRTEPGLAVQAAAELEAGLQQERSTFQRQVSSDLSSITDPIGQQLVDAGIGKCEILDELRLTEQFHETRVGSAERLIAWYVFLHAMAAPVSRLPFLGFELGKSESRLRVASTPAPVPAMGMPEGQGICESGLEKTDPAAVLSPSTSVRLLI
jgi:hypothetical protein